MADDGLVRFHCSKCNKRLKALTEHAGRKVACSQCGSAVVVPTPDVQDSDLIGLPGFGEPPPPPRGALPPMLPPPGAPLPIGPRPGEIRCPHCAATLADDPTIAGSVVACPRCGQPFQMPSPVGPAVSSLEDHPTIQASRARTASRHKTKPLDGETKVWLSIGVVALFVLALSTAMPWIHIALISFPGFLVDGSLVLAGTVLVGVFVGFALCVHELLRFAACVASAWGTLTLCAQAGVVYWLNRMPAALTGPAQETFKDMPTEQREEALRWSFTGVREGLYLGLAASAAVAATFAYIALRRRARSGPIDLLLAQVIALSLAVGIVAWYVHTGSFFVDHLRPEKARILPVFDDNLLPKTTRDASGGLHDLQRTKKPTNTALRDRSLPSRGQRQIEMDTKQKAVERFLDPNHFDEMNSAFVPLPPPGRDRSGIWLHPNKK